MSSQMPEHGNERGATYNDSRDTMIALLFAILLNAGIIGLFMFITWFTYATD